MNQQYQTESKDRLISYKNNSQDIIVPGDKSFDYYKQISLNEGFPLVSLIVPTYNLEKYIPQTIDSIRGQSADNSLFEVLFVDDCSLDRTKEVTQREIRDVENCISISTPQNGKSWATKNYGIRSSRGKYVMLLDGDDFLEPSAIESTLEFMSKNPSLKYSYSQHRKIDSSNKILYERKGFDFSREKLLNFNFVGAVECYEKELFEKIGGYRNLYVEDYDFALRASEVLEEGEIARNPTVLYNHRLHENGKTTGKENARNSAMLAIKESLFRKEGISANVKFSGYNEEQNTCFSWEVA